MKRAFRPGRYANVTSTLALVVALGGTGAYAANTIRSSDIVNGQVKSADIGSKQVKNADLAISAVTSGTVRDGALLAKDFKAGELPKGANGTNGTNGAPGAPGVKGDKGDKGDTGTVDTSAFHTKVASDARYLRGTITVTVTDSVPAGTFSADRADCPAGHQAVGGGVDVNNVLTMQVTSSGPIIDGARTLALAPAPGQHPAATGWQASAVNNTAAAAPMVVSVICSPIG